MNQTLSNSRCFLRIQSCENARDKARELPLHFVITILLVTIVPIWEHTVTRKPEVNF